MTIPAPLSGLVINYVYLWWSEDLAGLSEGRKERPRVILATRTMDTGLRVATVVPITHVVPRRRQEAVELPPPLKAHLGLDDERSFLMVTEVNDFIWPGPDLRPIARTKPGTFHFGMLPPRFFAHVSDRLLDMQSNAGLKRVTRTE